MAQIFLSYAREDRECAELFARELSARGWTVWWDRRIQVGRSFSEVIERELDDASCVVVLWSRNAVASPWVQTEAGEAARRNVLVPIRIEEIRLPLEFRRLHTADLFEWRTNFGGPDLDDCFASIEILAPRTPAAGAMTGGREDAPRAAEPRKPAEGPAAVNDTTGGGRHPSNAIPSVPPPEPDQSSRTSSGHDADVRQASGGCWINQDGHQFYAPDLSTLTRWAEERRIRADGHVYDASRQQWIRAGEVASLRSAWRKKTAAATSASEKSPRSAPEQQRPALPETPAVPAKSKRWQTAAAATLLIILSIILASFHVLSTTDIITATDTAATSTAATMASDTSATDTTTTDATTTDATAATATSSTDTATTAATSTDDATNSTPISISLENKCAQAILVAVCYRDAAAHWITSGWFRVEPNATTPNVVRAYFPKVYFYGIGVDGTVFPGTEGDSMTTMLAADFSKSFEVAQADLKGDGVRQVAFGGDSVAAGESGYTRNFHCK